MAKKELTIKDWHKGAASSRYDGFEFMSCVDNSEKGILKVNTKTDAMGEDSGTPVASLIYWFDQGRTSTGSTGRIFAYAKSAYHFYDTVGSTWDPISASQIGNGEGMVCYSGSNLNKAYMLVGDDGDLHALDCSTTGSPSWDYDITTSLQDVAWHPMIVAQNDRVYIGNGRYVAELYENSGETFDPGDTDTFTITTEKLDLPSDYIVRCMEELGSYLLIGTYNDIKSNSADIFVWDKSSDSFDRILRINNVEGINQLITYKNLTYIQAGTKGEWFVTNGSSVEKLGELPQPSTTKLNLTFSPGAVAVIKDKIYFGVGGGGAQAVDYVGIWSIDTKTGGTKREYVLSSGIATDEQGFIGALMARTGDNLIFSWQHTDSGDSDTFGVDETNVSYNLYTGSEAYAITPFFNIGDVVNKGSFKASMIKLAKALNTNESVTIYKRTERDGSWDTFITMTEGQSKLGPRVEGENVQFKIVMVAEGTDGPELIEFKLI